MAVTERQILLCELALRQAESDFVIEQRKILLKKLKLFQGEEGFLEESVKSLLEKRIKETEERIAEITAHKMLGDLITEIENKNDR